ncbi:outer membrane beta-barrel protein [bacterium SCSIO 12643]|nr:outer membrane beta-barrel protein [bacterium SCSIO 12643]
MRPYLFFLLFNSVLFYPILASGQKNDWGLNIGYGISNFSPGSKTVINPFLRNQPQHLSAGVSYDYSPWKAFISLRTGLWYANRKQNDTALNYFKIPIGFDLNFGKNHQFIFGGGLYGAVLFHYNGLPKTFEFKNQINRFVLGSYLNLGISLRVSDHHYFSLRYQINYDSSPLLNPEKSVNQNNFTLSDGIFTLGLKYRVPQRRSK